MPVSSRLTGEGTQIVIFLLRWLLAREGTALRDTTGLWTAGSSVSGDSWKSFSLGDSVSGMVGKLESLGRAERMGILKTLSGRWCGKDRDRDIPVAEAIVCKGDFGGGVGDVDDDTIRGGVD